MISVIVPVFNGERSLPACLEGLQHQTGFTLGLEYEVIIVDDGSTDRTIEICQHFGVQAIHLANHGPAFARNTGARAAKGDLLVFTDADCVPQENWLQQLTAPFRDERVVGVKGAYKTYQKQMVPRFVQLEYEDKYQRMKQFPQIDFIDTYSAAYRREIFLKNGGFNTSFTVPSVEDQEFSFRLARKGYKLLFEPHAIVFHQHDEGIKEYFLRKYHIGYWKAFMLRWLPEKTFADSHTPASQRWQILFLGFAVIFALFGWIKPIFWCLSGCLLFAFFLSGWSLIRQIQKNDPVIIWISFPLILCRAAALGMGLISGFLFPPVSVRKGQRQGLNSSERVIKRAFDILGALLGLIVSCPLVLLIAIAIRLDSPGPSFFIQERIGENGKKFRIIKMRTMIDQASRKVEELLEESDVTGPVYKHPCDPRITRVGRFLRRWSLDELPQLWNVLHGEMSLVGPRPEETRFVEMYNDLQRQRLVMKPGLTGPMQVSGRGALNMDERLAVELDYIQNYSLLKDIQILVRSIPVIISGKGAY
jgi:lipopolysaccharide/colanic/teichoic acid biosynthesis glycosyltransferase/glycosyltransferase involved in cell wall biosynthesis